METVDLFITVCDSDINFLRANFLYLISASAYNFSNIYVYTDNVINPHIGLVLEEYRKRGFITDIRAVDYSLYDNITAKYSKPNGFINYKGNYAYLSGLEACHSDYILHYDPDIFLFSRPGYSWVKEAIEILTNNIGIMAVNPCGFPGANSDKSFVMANTFTTRCFLVRNSFKEITGLKVVKTFEDAVTEYLAKTGSKRAELQNSINCFILHSQGKWLNKLEELRKISRLIYKGIYPQSQKGNCELDENSYLDLIKNSNIKIE